MAAISALIGVAGLALSAAGASKQRSASKAAAEGQRRAAAESADLIASAGAAGEKDILAAQQEAAKRIALGATEAEAQVSPFTAATGGFDAAENLILGGGPSTDLLAQSIRDAAIGGAGSPALSNITGGDALARAIQGGGDLAISQATPDLIASLLSQGTQGIGAVGDVASIRQRGFESLADIASSSAAGRASTLVGQTPGLLSLAQSGQEARLLGDVAGQKFNTRLAEDVAKTAGRFI